MASESEILIDYFRWIRSRGGYAGVNRENEPLLSDEAHREACLSLKRHPAVVRRVSAAQSSEAAVIDFLSEVIDSMDIRDRVILSIVLGPVVLRWSKDTSLPNGTLPPYRENTTARRKYVCENYIALVEGMGGQFEEGETAPKEGSLREVNGMEDRAIASLVELILNLKTNPDDPQTTKTVGRAIVFGMAVMDHVYRLPDQSTPSPPGSVQVEYLETPGGKGLAQAIAMRRMGFDTTLVAAVGDDHNAGIIVDLLKDEGMPSEALVTRAGQRTPITGLLTYPFGGSFALGWKNENRVRLEPDDIDVAFIRYDVDNADFVLITYELPIDIIGLILQKLPRRLVDGIRKPTVVLAPAPPIPQRHIPAEIFRVDYVVTNDWESQRFLGDGRTETDSVRLAGDVLSLGVGAVCTYKDGQLTISQRHGDPLIRSAWPFSMRHDSTGERDALIGALSHELMVNFGKLDDHSLAFITAAMAKSVTTMGVPRSMPRPGDVIEFMMSTNSSVADGYMRRRMAAAS